MVPPPEWGSRFEQAEDGVNALDQLGQPTAAIEALVAFVEVSVATSTGAPRACFARLAA